MNIFRHRAFHFSTVRRSLTRQSRLRSHKNAAKFVFEQGSPDHTFAHHHRSTTFHLYRVAPGFASGKICKWRDLPACHKLAVGCRRRFWRVLVPRHRLQLANRLILAMRSQDHDVDMTAKIHPVTTVQYARFVKARRFPRTMFEASL